MKDGPGKPSPRAVRKALQLARHLRVDEYRLVRVPIDRMIPEGKPPKVARTLVAIMGSTPSAVAPPLVFYASAGAYEILDGRHRWEAARRAGLPEIWALEVLRGCPSRYR